MYKIIRNDGSGHCLFYSIAQGIIHKLNTDDDYKTIGKELRKIAVDEMRRRMEKDETYKMILSVMYASEVNGNFERDNSNEYLKWMGKSAWGGDMEIKALEKFVHKLKISGIRIYYAEKNMRLINGFGTRIKKLKYPVIKLILHRADIGGTHYEYVYKIKNSKKKKCS